MGKKSWMYVRSYLTHGHIACSWVLPTPVHALHFYRYDVEDFM